MPCWLSMTAYSVYFQLPFISEGHLLHLQLSMDHAMVTGTHITWMCTRFEKVVKLNVLLLVTFFLYAVLFSTTRIRVPVSKSICRASILRICYTALCCHTQQLRLWNSQLQEGILLVWSRNTIHWVTQECGLLMMDVSYIILCNFLCV